MRSPRTTTPTNLQPANLARRPATKPQQPSETVPAHSVALIESFRDTPRAKRADTIATGGTHKSRKGACTRKMTASPLLSG